MDNNICMDPKKVVSDALFAGLELSAYFKIMEAVKAENFKATPEFRRLFNGYYRIRQRSQAWYNRYYEILEEQLKNPGTYTFEDILRELVCQADGKIEPSFTSKLLATADPQLPIWDQNVLRNLGLNKKWNKYSGHSRENRIKAAVEIYAELTALCNEILASSAGKASVAALTRALSLQECDALTDMKKLDLILWTKQ